MKWLLDFRLRDWRISGSSLPFCMHRVVSLDKKLYSTLSFLTQVLSMGNSESLKPNKMLEGNPVMDQHPIQGGAVMLLVTSCWVPCDGLPSHPGESSNAPSRFMLGTL